MKPKNRIKKVIDDIKWNTARQDDRAQERKEKDVKAAIAKAYHLTKQAFISQRRTTVEVFDFPKKLMDAIAAIPNIDLIPDWKQYTIGLLDDKAAQVMALKLTTKNHITQILPAESPKDVKPFEGDFMTPEEFVAIPFLQPFIKHEDFIGFVLDHHFLGALFKDESVTVVAKLLNTRGVEKLPTLEQMQAELKKLPETEEEE